MRRRVERELLQRAGQQAERRDAYDHAARNLQAGRLESGRLAIDRLEGSEHRQRLHEQLDMRAQRSEQLLEQARDVLARGDALTACRFWEEACNRHGRTRQSDAFASELVPAYRAMMEEAFESGRLDHLRSALDATRSLRTFAPTLSEYERLAELAKQAAERLVAGDFDDLRETLLRLQAARRETLWIKSALKSVDDVVRAQGQLLSSPLGLLGTSLYGKAALAKAVPAPSGPTAGRPEETVYRGQGAELHEEPQLMLVDGTGSVLLVPRDLVRLGRAGSPGGVAIPIPADIQSHHADIIRHGEDYFLVAHGPVRVNRKPVSRTLLRHGDRIVLGASAKMVFHKPSAKSDTAVLKLSSRCRLPQDVSLVVLFKGTCLLGPQSTCHVQTREGDTRLVLFDRGGELFVRRAARDGRPTGPAEALPAHETREFGDVRLTVKGYEPHGPGRPA